MAMASLVGRTMTSAKHIAKAICLAKVMALYSGQSHAVLKILNLAKIMAWLWYEVGHEDGVDFGCDHGQDIESRIFHGR